MARDRQRAKQRRRARAGTERNPPTRPAPSRPQRANVPGELDHASGEVDEFEAAIVTGSGERNANADAEDAFGEGAGDERELERQAVESGPAAARAAERPAGVPTRRGPARFAAFLRACWSELQRVQWPDRRQVGQATMVVIGFVIVAGLYLGVADYVAKQLVNAII